MQAIRSRTANKIYELKDEYSKITKHHKIQPEKLLETEILDALAEFICSPDQIDKHQLLQMENELIKMTNFADDKEQAYKINFQYISYMEYSALIPASGILTPNKYNFLQLKKIRLIIKLAS